MSVLDAYDVPFSEVEATVVAWTTEAVGLRHSEAGDPEGKLSTGSDESPAEAVAFLRRIRARADRVDELLQAAKRARGRARRALAAITFDADNAVSENIQKQGRREFESHRAREVEAKLANFDMLRNQHQARRLLDVTEEAVDVINQMHWSLDALRKDVRATLHALQFESSLER